MTNFTHARNTKLSSAIGYKATRYNSAGEVVDGHAIVTHTTTQPEPIDGVQLAYARYAKSAREEGKELMTPADWAQKIGRRFKK